MSQLISKHRNAALLLALWAGATTVVMFWLSMRRSGFNTPYNRVAYLVQMGEYRQRLEAGTAPSNVHLPPHLRLDKISYLDAPGTQLAAPPTVDVVISERDLVRGVAGQIPTHASSSTGGGGGDLHVAFGPIRTQTVIMTGQARERYVRRRLGPAPGDREGRPRGEGQQQGAAAGGGGETGNE